VHASSRSSLFIALLCSLVLFTTAGGWAKEPPPDKRVPRRSPTPTASPQPTATRRPFPESARVPILMYHYVGDAPPTADRLRRDLTVSAAAFEAQMAWLRDNGYTTITLDQLYEYLNGGEPLPPRPVVLTFDDGYLDAYTVAFPTLKKYGHTGAFFVIADFINYSNPEHATWSQLREMADAGMRIESHSRTHIDLRRRSNAVLVWELLGPAEQIEAFIGRKPRFFSYPTGRYDAAVIQILRDLGTNAALTTEIGRTQRLSTAMLWPRLRVRNTTTIEGFANLVAK
jgi:peptidoglycan/xylan/chitin deacetylase (PgdA/CDA1 family)